MSAFPEGSAIVYCQRAFQTTNGKTAHGLMRRTERYRVLSVVDSTCAGADAGTLLDGEENGIPVVGSVREAYDASMATGQKATHLVIGLAPDGGRLCADARKDVRSAIELGLNVDCGLHDFLSEDAELSALASRHGVRLRDVRKPPPRDQLHFFSGKIEKVTSLKVASLGTDSAIGKRTTAWRLIEGLRNAGFSAEMIGTGQTAWMQGARFSIILDSLVNDFVSGEIEHAVWSAWNEMKADVIVLEGQGSLMNPAYPGGYELLAAGRPDVVVLQHAPARKEYDGFPGYPLHPIEKQIHAVELISSKPVIAVTINHEHLNDEQLESACADLRKRTGLPVVDVLRHGPGPLVAALKPHITKAKECKRA